MQGETRIFLATKAPYLNENGEVAGIIGISRLAGRSFVQKPFSPLSLARTIRQVLDQG